MAIQESHLYSKGIYHLAGAAKQFICEKFRNHAAHRNSYLFHTKIVVVSRSFRSRRYQGLAIDSSITRIISKVALYTRSRLVKLRRARCVTETN